MITCKRCGESKDESHFYWRKNGRPQSMCIECRSVYRKEKMSDPEKHAAQLERQRLWNESHRDYINAYSKEWYADPENHTRVRTRSNEYNRERYKNDPKVKVRKALQKDESVQRRKDTPEYIKKQKGWTRTANHKRRILLKGAKNVENLLTDSEWNEICAKYDYRCLRCGERTELTVDHIVPITKGGLHTKENVQPLCKSCNARKYTKIVDFRPTTDTK